MPRVTALIAEVGTTGTTERLDLTGYAAIDIAEAVRLEHECSDPSCDINVALTEAECPFTAAWLLQGATETPLLDSVLAHYRIDSRDFPPDFNAWQEHHQEFGVECDACGSFTYGDEWWTPETCANCLAALPEEEEVDEAA